MTITFNSISAKYYVLSTLFSLTVHSLDKISYYAFKKKKEPLDFTDTVFGTNTPESLLLVEFYLNTNANAAI